LALAWLAVLFLAVLCRVAAVGVQLLRRLLLLRRLRLGLPLYRQRRPRLLWLRLRLRLLE
jgi:hypothetical protein